MLRRSFPFFLCAIALLLALWPSNLLGQVAGSGSVLGRVTDPSGAVIPNATVTLKNESTGSIRTTKTNTKGAYIFPGVNAGLYSVTVTKQGFNTAIIADQTVHIAVTLTVNAVLHVGAVSTTVTVSATAGADLQTTNATVGGELSSALITRLPNVGLDATSLAVLQPGETIDGAPGGETRDQNSFQVDGGFATDDMGGDVNAYVSSFASDVFGGMATYKINPAPSAVFPIPTYSVEQMSVATSNQTASFSGAAGSQVQVETKSGTNTFHGNVYEYYLDTKFGSANTWDQNYDNEHYGTQIPSAHYSRFGADAGYYIPHFHYLGGKWYVFGNYEGYRFPQVSSFEQSFPSAAMREGLITLDGETINLNNTAVNGFAPNAATCVSASGCDNGTYKAGAVINCTGVGGCNGGLGVNPTITAFWNKYLPLPTDTTSGDGVNYYGYPGTISTPQSSNFGVFRLDHDFSKIEHFNSTLHYYKLSNSSAGMWDIGGFFPGDTKGQYAAIKQVPQNSWMYTAGLTSTLAPTLTNDIHFSFTRNYWAYADPNAVPNLAGYPANADIGGGAFSGETVFGPFNDDNQDLKDRFWDGHDWLVRDDITWLRGSHLITMGGSYLREDILVSKDDTGINIGEYPQYLVGNGQGESNAASGLNMSGYVPAGVQESSSGYDDLYDSVLGIVSTTQALYSYGLGSISSGLPLNPFQSCADSAIPATALCQNSPPVVDSLTMPSYNIYFNDSWSIKPSFTLNYGLGYTLEMPGYSQNGEASAMVDQTDHLINLQQYLNSVYNDALHGTAYAPIIGFSTIRNVSNSGGYSYNPYYGGFSPRAGLAWKFAPETVLRAGYARIYGRLNGVLPGYLPIDTPGFFVPDMCGAPAANGTCGNSVPSVNATNAAWRIGDVNSSGTFAAPLATPAATEAQPYYPGLNGIGIGSAETISPDLYPDISDEFTVGIQHQFGPKILAEIGYIGRLSHNLPVYYSITAVPYMLTLDGQTFANAWKNVMVATNYGTTNLSNIPQQPWFEAAFPAGYCQGQGYSNCTNMFVQQNDINNSALMYYDDPFDTWNEYQNQFAFGRSTTSSAIPNSPYGANGQTPSLITEASTGYGNYNDGYLQLTVSNWHNLTMKSVFNYSKALGVGYVDQARTNEATNNPWNLQDSYGPQWYDERFNFNLFFTYAEPFFSNQQGFLGRLLGGWQISPILTAGSGTPIQLGTANGDCGSFGECNTLYIHAMENMVATSPWPNPQSASEHAEPSDYASLPCGNVGYGYDAFSNPMTTCPVNGGIFGDPVRNPILGLDGEDGGGGPVYGLPFWNMDLGLSKNIKFHERYHANVYFQYYNVFNHMQPGDPCYYSDYTSAWGVLGCGGNLQANNPRQLQLGLDLTW